MPSVTSASRDLQAVVLFMLPEVFSKKKSVRRRRRYGSLPVLEAIGGHSCALRRSFPAAGRAGTIAVASAVALELKRRRERSDEYEAIRAVAQLRQVIGQSSTSGTQSDALPYPSRFRDPIPV